MASFLSYGFRPFFLLAALQACLSVVAWLAVYSGYAPSLPGLHAVSWHIHEMLYGYVPAVIGGFLLTAIANWTGRPPVSGARLALLVAAWLIGRATMLAGEEFVLLAAIADVAFLVLLLATASYEVIAARNWRNLAPLALVLALLVGNIAFHAERLYGGSGDFGTRIGIAAAIGLIMLIGGRVIPLFTRNWLKRENPGRLPSTAGALDKLALALAGLALLLWIATPQSPATTAMMGAAGIFHLARLGTWAGDRSWREPLVLIMHIGYLFVPLGFILLAVSTVAPDWAPRSAGVHAWTVGAIGTLTLAIMSRATLGHTGRPLHAGPMTQAIYTAVVSSALARITAAMAPLIAMEFLWISGAAWLLAFGGFAIGYGSLLTSRKSTG